MEAIIQPKSITHQPAGSLRKPVLKKRKPIFFHQTQKDGVMFQSEDSREFWVRAEDRNKDTAEKYKALGLASYAAMEAFVRYHF